MIFSIRKRMFIILLALSIPMCAFAWLLMQEVQKQIDFAAKESQGVQMQQPLVKLLHDIHGRKLALMQGEDAASWDQQIAAHAKAAINTYKEVGSSVGFTEQSLTESDRAKIGISVEAKTWSSAFPEVIAKTGQLTANASDESLSQHTALAAAIKALIVRASDGSNLTLDPDLDSYYVMDAISFALPNAIDTLGNTHADLLRFLPSRDNGLAPKQFGQIEKWEFAIASNDAARITGSLGTALSEDANFYGASDGLNKLQDQIKDYEKTNAALLALIDTYYETQDPITAQEIGQKFAAINTAVMTLSERASAEMDTLLKMRIDHFEEYRKSLLMQAGAVVLVGLLIFWVVSRSIVSPVNRLRVAMQELANGNVDAEVPYLKKRDEIGQMAKTLIVFQENAKAIQLVTKDFERSIKQVVEIVAAAATEMDCASKDLTHRAQESHEKLKELNMDVMGVAESMQMVSGAGDQLYAAINEISSQMHKSTSTTNQAVQEAGHVKKVAESLSAATQQITGIVGIINGIASKITLLALNATIEAARAGEVGKGFAVVANEVKALATQTANATAQISELVTHMQGSSTETLEAITQITGVIDEMNQIAGIIAAAVEEQGAATKEIAGHIKKASERVENITGNVDVVTKSASASSVAANQTQQTSNELSKQSESLKAHVDSFLRSLLKAA